MVNRKNDMQKIILEILLVSKKRSIPFLTHAQISKEVRKLKPREEFLERKISQALWLLGEKERQQKVSWDKPNFKKVEKKGPDGKIYTLGYTVDKIV